MPKYKLPKFTLPKYTLPKFTLPKYHYKPIKFDLHRSLFKYNLPNKRMKSTLFMKPILKINMVLMLFVLVISAGIAVSYLYTNSTGAAIISGPGFGGGADGGLENVLPPVTPPVTLDPLEAVTNLQIVGTTKDSVSLTFTLPCNGDPDICESNVINDFQIRYSTGGAITDNTILGTQVGATYCSPGVICLASDEGVPFTRTVSGLESGTKYWFAVKYTHSTRGDSLFSNSPSATTIVACIPSGAEICDGVDNDCDEFIDEQILELCPLQQGVCAGTQRGCSVGLPTSCNYGSAELRYEPNKETLCADTFDNDCDGKTDVEDQDCIGDVVCSPQTEICNNQDDDCDGTIDEDFNVISDSNNCGTCGNVCNYPNVALHTCELGQCGFQSCETGFYDRDDLVENGCEYECSTTNNGAEIQDGLDNDCDGTVDNGFVVSDGEDFGQDTGVGGSGGEEGSGGDITPSSAEDSGGSSGGGFVDESINVPSGPDAETELVGIPQQPPKSQQQLTSLDLQSSKDKVVQTIKANIMPIIIIIVSVILTGILLYLYKRTLISDISEEQPLQQVQQTMPLQQIHMSKLDNYISNALRRGYTEEQLKNILVRAGWDLDILEMSFRKFRNKFSRED